MFEREVNNSNISQADIVVGLAYYNQADGLISAIKTFSLSSTTL